MKSIFMTKNDELKVIIGTVKATDDQPGKFIVKLEIDTYDTVEQTEKKQIMDIFFQNQQPQAGSERTPILWADNAKRMKMKIGSVIAVLARPNESLTKADGYVCRYNGVITFAADENHTRERNCVGGLVTWLKEKVDSNNNPYISMGVYLGKDRDNNMKSATIKTNDEKMMERCRRALTPRTDGTKKNAWFSCGEVYWAVGSDGNEYPIYTMFDFTITGSRSKN